MTAWYAIAGRVIQSSINLPELHAVSRPAQVWLSVANGPPSPPGDIVRRYADDEGCVWLELERTPRGYCFRFVDLAEFGFDRASSKLTVFSESNSSNADMRHMLLDQVIPLLMVIEGLTVLHASAVAVGTGSGLRALLFTGESGAGKSTTAAGCHLAGAALLADDFAVVDTDGRVPTVTLSGTGSRLWSDVTDHIEPRSSLASVRGERRKARLPATRPDGPVAVPISAIYVLAERSDSAAHPKVTPLGPSEACMCLIRQSFRARLDDAKENQRSTEAAARLVEGVAVRRLTIPARLDDLVGVCRQILELEVPGRRGKPRSASPAASR